MMGNEIAWFMLGGMNENIEQQVLYWACKHGVGEGWNIAEIRLNCEISWGVLLSYKQVRDALYRLKNRCDFKHLERGNYVWLS